MQVVCQGIGEIITPKKAVKFNFSGFYLSKSRSEKFRKKSTKKEIFLLTIFFNYDIMK